MKLAFSAPTRDEAQQRLLMERFADFGYAGLQLKTAQFQDDLEEPQRLLDRWPTLHGAISGLILGAKLDEAGQAKVRRVLRFAEAVGADLVILCQGERREGLSDRELADFADVLDELGKDARDRGTKLSLHQHYNQPCMHRADLDIFFDKRRKFGLTVDTAHMVKSGVTNVAEVIRTFAPAIDNFHIKDFADGEFRVLGTGAVDFGPIFEAMHDIGYTGWVAADEESGGDLAASLRASHAFLEQHLLQRSGDET